MPLVCMYVYFEVCTYAITAVVRRVFYVWRWHALFPRGAPCFAFPILYFTIPPTHDDVVGLLVLHIFRYAFICTYQVCICIYTYIPSETLHLQ